MSSTTPNSLSGTSDRSTIERPPPAVHLPAVHSTVDLQQRLEPRSGGPSHRSSRPRRDLREEASRRLSKWFRVALLVTIAVVLVVVADSMLGTLMYRSRQGQLAADFVTPRNFQATDRAIAVLQIPSLGVNQTVAQGIGSGTLRGGPGHAPDSAIPGAQGNAVIFGHLRRFGGPFAEIRTLQPGDIIYVQPKGTSEIVSYAVTKVTSGGDELLSSLAASDETKLSLVTSSGGVSSSNRTVVEAVADAPAARLPKRTSEPTSVASFEVRAALFNAWHLGALVWLLLAVAVRRVTLGMYAKRTRLLLVAPLVSLGLLFLWLSVDSWLASTL
jgi:LPXTG-site transpeptidase (sortase) family protein